MQLIIEIRYIYSYNNIKFYLLHDEENPKIKYVIYMFNEDSKIIKDKKDKAMKQSEFQQTVLKAIDKINNLDSKINSLENKFENFKNYVIEKFEKQEKFNESILQEIKVLKKFHKNEL